MNWKNSILLTGIIFQFEPTTRPVVFADWASGVSSVPDPETVNKHIAAMVEAVFKHYDHDRDGYISQVEFRQIAGNFPFIESFGTIDVDRYGFFLLFSVSNEFFFPEMAKFPEKKWRNISSTRTRTRWNSERGSSTTSISRPSSPPRRAGTVEDW